MKRTIYVGGVRGDGQPPLSAWASLEMALIDMVEFFIFAKLDEREYREIWSCAFLGGEPSDLEWTHTMADGRVLYVRGYEVDTEQEAERLRKTRMIED